MTDIRKNTPKKQNLRMEEQEKSSLSSRRAYQADVHESEDSVLKIVDFKGNLDSSERGGSGLGKGSESPEERPINSMRSLRSNEEFSK